jgi:ABC-type dipeptide/oligopeptide/nickel transport system permease subunit
MASRQVLAGSALVLVLIASIVAVPLFDPWTPEQMSASDTLAPPTAAHLLGTDQFGRDILSRIASGGVISLTVGAMVTSCAMSAGVLIGSLAGFLGGWTDILLMRAMDALLAFPGILLALALVAALSPGLFSVVLALSIVAVPRFARVVRGAVLRRKEYDYVTAATAIGAPPARVLLRTVLPNCIGPIVVQATLTLPGAILGEAGLSFLGLGTPPPAPSWGRMLFEARGTMEIAPEGAIFVGIVVSLTVLAFNFLGDGLRDVLDPRGPRSA